MSRTCVVQFSDRGIQDPLLNLTISKHYEHCKRFNYKYFVSQSRRCVQRHVYWEKVVAISETLNAVMLECDNLVWIDTDAYWLGNEPLTPEFDTPFAAVRHRNPPHFNCGVLYCKVSSEVDRLVDLWWKSSCHNHHWQDQHAFNLLVESNQIACTEIDKKYNSTFGTADYISPNPVVAAWHGCGNRKAEMAAFIERHSR